MNDENKNSIIHFEADINVIPTTGSTENIRLFLPITTDEFTKALQAAGIGDPETCDIIFLGIDCDIDNLDNLLPDVDSITYETFNELNYLAAKVQKLDDYDVDHFNALLTNDVPVGHSIVDFINLVENLNHYNFEPVDDAEDFGHYIIENQFNWPILKKLAASDSPDEQRFAGDISLYIEHINKESLGQAVAKKEGGIFTSHGYLTKNEDKIENVYHDVNDIPAKYRILHDDETFPTVKNVELTSFLIKMHALGGINQQKVSNIIDALGLDVTSHHLLLMTNSDMHIVPFQDTYYTDTEAFKTCQNWAKLSDASAFEIEINSKDDKLLFGDVRELDFRKLFADIMAHCIVPASILASTPDGHSITYSGQEWSAMDNAVKKNFTNATLVPDIQDLWNLKMHISESTLHRTRNSKTIKSSDFLSKLNRPYMEQSKNKQTNMLRIPPQMAKEILSRGNMPVYRMADGVLNELSPIDALRLKSGSWSSHFEFAVWPSALDEINKLAKRQRNVILKKLTNQLDSPDKQHNKGWER